MLYKKIVVHSFKINLVWFITTFYILSMFTRCDGTIFTGIYNGENYMQIKNYFHPNFYHSLAMISCKINNTPENLLHVCLQFEPWPPIHSYVKVHTCTNTKHTKKKSFHSPRYLITGNIFIGICTFYLHKFVPFSVTRRVT